MSCFEPVMDYEDLVAREQSWGALTDEEQLRLRVLEDLERSIQGSGDKQLFVQAQILEILADGPRTLAELRSLDLPQEGLVENLRTLFEEGLIDFECERYSLLSGGTDLVTDDEDFAALLGLPDELGEEVLRQAAHG